MYNKSTTNPHLIKEVDFGLYRVTMNAHRCLQHVSSDTRAWCGSRWLADSYVVVVVAVPCGAGTYYNIELDRCSLCHPGSYQHQQAQLQCQNCPPGTATVQYGATDIQQCEGSV